MMVSSHSIVAVNVVPAGTGPLTVFTIVSGAEPGDGTPADTGPATSPNDTSATEPAAATARAATNRRRCMTALQSSARPGGGLAQEQFGDELYTDEERDV